MSAIFPTTGNLVYASPDSASGQPSFRAIVAGDIPSLPASKLTSGTVNVAQLPVLQASGVGHAAGIAPDPGGSSGTTHFLREDATWAVPPNSGGTVTSITVTVPAWLSVSPATITSSGTFAISAASGQTANQVLATPNGSSGAVGLRALVAGDIPNIAESQVTNLTADLGNCLLTSGSRALAGNWSAGNNYINNLHDPSSAQDAATKNYVDAAIVGLQVKPTAQAATAAALPSNTYNNSAGTITGIAFGALTVDGYTPSVGDVILVKNEATAANNGLYTVTVVGSGVAAFVLTRHADMNAASEFSGALVPVGNLGTANANSLWLANPTTPVTVGTTAIPFTQLNGATDLQQGTAISISGNTISVSMGSTSTTACVGNDSRLSNARTPTAHASTHQNGGSDEVATAIAAANAIPKAGAGGTLDKAWLPVFAASGASHAAGAVPDPGATADTSRFVREDGTFAPPAASTQPAVDQDFATNTTTIIWGDPFIPASGIAAILESGALVILDPRDGRDDLWSGNAEPGSSSIVYPAAVLEVRENPLVLDSGNVIEVCSGGLIVLNPYVHNPDYSSMSNSRPGSEVDVPDYGCANIAGPLILDSGILFNLCAISGGSLLNLV